MVVAVAKLPSESQQLNNALDEFQRLRGSKVLMAERQIHIQDSDTIFNDGNVGSAELQFMANISSAHTLDPGHLEIEWRLSGPVLNTQPVLADDVAPAYNMPANMFSKVEGYVDGKLISEMATFPAESDTAKKRLFREGALHEGYYGDLNWMQSDFETRQAHVSSDGFIQGKASHGLFSSGVSALGLGFTGATDYEYKDATNEILFAVVAGTTLAAQFAVGDYIELHAENVVTAPHAPSRITSITATQLFVETKLGIDIASRTLTLGNDFTGYGFDGRNNSRRTRRFVTPWKPSLGLFQKSLLPAGDWEFRFQVRPDAEWRRNVVESLVTNLTHATDYHIEFLRARWIYHTQLVRRLEDKPLPMQLLECKVNKKQIVGENEDLHFPVHPSTYGVIVGIQDTRLNGTTLTNNSRLVSFNTAFTAREESTFTDLRVEYGGVVWSTEKDTDLSFVSGEDIMARLYGRNIEEARRIRGGGPEVFLDFMNTGLFAFIPFDKETDNRAKQVIVRFKFPAIPDSSQVVVVSLYAGDVALMIKNGRVSNSILRR